MIRTTWTFRIPGSSSLSEGLHPYGMFTFDQSLAKLVMQKLVTYEEAIKNSASPSDFALQFRGVSGGGDGLETGADSAFGAGDQSSGGDLEIDRFGK